jgi:hypothetical protein
LRFNNKTNANEFYPEYFIEPLRNFLEFQESIVHTQLFVAFIENNMMILIIIVIIIIII